MKPRKSESVKLIVDFFHEKGEVLTRSAYIASPDAPIPYRHFTRYFNGKSYNIVLKLCRKHYPVEWASIGSVMKEEAPPQAPAPAPKVVKPKVKKPAKEAEPSLLDKMKSAKGESDG